MIEKGTVVISLRGHDKGSWLMALYEEGGRIYVADGRLRPLGRPKAKNPRHLSVTKKVLRPEEYPTDRQLSRALRALQKTDQ